MRQSEVIARKRALMARIQTEGIEAAYSAAVAICQDPKAPSPARATCVTALFRAGGLMNSKEDSAPKEPHQMTADELEARVAELRAATAGLIEEGDDAPDDGVFD